MNRHNLHEQFGRLEHWQMPEWAERLMDKVLVNALFPDGWDSGTRLVITTCAALVTTCLIFLTLTIVRRIQTGNRLDNANWLLVGFIVGLLLYQGSLGAHLAYTGQTTSPDFIQVIRVVFVIAAIMLDVYLIFFDKREIVLVKSDQITSDYHDAQQEQLDKITLRRRVADWRAER